MDTSLQVNPKPVAIVPAPPELQRQIDTKVPRVEAADKSATLPTEKPFVAQVVSARLSGTAFPDNPKAIAPPERMLRPYNTPMLPAEKPEPIKAEEPETPAPQAEQPPEPVETAQATEPEPSPAEPAADTGGQATEALPADADQPDSLTT